MKNIKNCLLSLAVLIAALPAMAQQTEVRGTVTDPAGEPLVGVTVMGVSITKYPDGHKTYPF